MGSRVEPINRDVTLYAISLAKEGLRSISNPYQNEFSSLPKNLVKSDDSIAPSDAGAEAAKLALSKANLTIGDVDLLISCTNTPDFNNPGLANLILHKLGAKEVPGLEIRQSSTGVLYALDIA